MLLEIHRGLAWSLILVLVLWFLWMLKRREFDQAGYGLVDIVVALIAVVATPVLLLLGGRFVAVRQ